MKIKNKKIDLSRFNNMIIDAKLEKSADLAYKMLKDDGAMHLLNKGNDGKYILTFLIYYFELKEEYSKCAWLKKVYESFIFLKLDKVEENQSISTTEEVLRYWDQHVEPKLRF